MGESARLAELVGGLTLASDLANVFPPEKTMRTAALAVALGRRAGLGPDALRDAYWVALFRFVGCTAFAHEEAHHYGAGEDLGVRNTMALADMGDLSGTARAIVSRVGRGGPLPARARGVARLLLTGAAAKHARAQCDASMRLAELAGMSEAVRAALGQVCERWDGRGEPARAAGEALAVACRLLHVADVAEIVQHRAGDDAAVDEVRRRAGRHLDPELGRIFVAHAGGLLAGIRGPSVWERFLDAEPSPVAVADEQRVDDVATAFAHFADLKSVFTLGHSPGVAALALGAAEGLGLPAEAARELRRAALLHDLGRVSVPNGIWDRPGRLGVAEWECVRLHAYYTERVILRAPAWSRAAKIAASAHERLDGSGYAKGAPGGLLARPERLLAAADVMQALREPRAHRPARAMGDAVAVMREEAKAGRLDPTAVDAVIAAARGAAPKPRCAPRRTTLTERELEVLRLVARGKSNPEIGELLGISRRTAQHHVEHTYDKIGVHSRAGAALYAVENGLLDVQ